MKDLLEEEGGKEKVANRLGQRPSRIMLKHIIQQVSNIANLTDYFSVSSIFTNSSGVQHCHQRPE